ncbi:MAG: proteobacterial dedicated sortase system histidine kinase [Vicinamibacteria bacterium]
MRLGLRAQLLIVSSLLLAIPILGLRSAREIEAFLVETQEQGLASTARAVATALHERPGIFVSDSTLPPSHETSRALRIETLSSPIIIDGQNTDWNGQRGEVHELTATATPEATDPPLRLRYRIGRYDRAIYLLIEVRDNVIVRHSSDFPPVNASDHVELAMVSADDEFLRFSIHEAEDGSTRVAQIGPDGVGLPDPRIEAALVETEDGYRIEARVPRTMIGARFGISVEDVDDAETRLEVSRVGTTATREDLGAIFVPSPELAVLAQGLGRARSRLWVIDRDGSVLAQAGTLQATPAAQTPPTWRQSLVMALRPIYRSILVEPTEDFTDKGPDAIRLEGPELTQTLTGASTHWRRRTTDGRVVVLSAAEPVWNEGHVAGAVLAEETTNETLAARNRAFEQLFFSIAFVVVAGTLTLLAFATRLSFRIRGLRNSVERAIDRQGRVRAEIQTSTAQDEVGDLSRSFGSMLERQQQYTAYLEDLRARLSHEIRTPVAVVRSSLDNLRLHQIPANASVYLDRADEGLSRLVTILQRMTEASRLEQTIAMSERESFDLSRVVSGCVEGYRLAHPQRRIDLVIDIGDRPLVMEGAPDLIAQLLDKLVENALDFAREGTSIEVRLIRGLGVAFLSVSNEGPTLPDEISGKVFESVVSARPADTSGKVHLGLGLTIVRAIADFHEATATAANRRDGNGAVFTVGFPLKSKFSER